MIKKFNVNYFKYMKQNKKELNIEKNILNFFKLSPELEFYFLKLMIN